MAEDKYEQIWTDVCDKVKSYENINPGQINAFFSRLHPQAFSEGYLMLTADNDWLKFWIESHYMEVISSALRDIYGVPFAIEIEVDEITPHAEPSPSPAPAVEAQPAPVQTPGPPVPAPAPTAQPSASALGERNVLRQFTFENFVVGPSNNMAYNMAMGVAETPGHPQYNPLFIYSKSGLGKTHLLCAIKNYVDDTVPGVKTVYVDATELVNDYAQASSKKTFDEFYHQYEDADVLLIDDVQSLQGKEGTLNVVFQIFNKMTASGRQIVLSADRAPKHIDLDERYQSRFNSGFTIDIQPPELETKLGIIKNFIEEYRRQEPDQQFEIGDDVQVYIAQTSGSNIRELKSSVTLVIVDAIQNGSSSLSSVERLLQDYFTSGSMRRLTIEDIQKVCEQYYGISHSDMVGKRRVANITHARQVAIYLCRTMIDVPFQGIGEAFNKDHTTAMYSYNAVLEKVKDDTELNGEIENLNHMLNEL